MKTSSSLFCLFGFLLLISCSPKILKTVSKSYTPLNYDEKVVVIGLNKVESKSSEYLGEISISDTGFTTKCDYTTVIESAKINSENIRIGSLSFQWHVSTKKEKESVKNEWIKIIPSLKKVKRISITYGINSGVS